MVALVQRRQKKFVRRNHIIEKVIRYSAPAALVRRISSSFFILFFLLVIVFVLRYIFYSTLLSPDYTIKVVRYDSGSVSLFDEPLLYSSITKYLQGKNYYIIKLFGQGRLFSEIQNQFPMLSSLDLFFLEKNIAAVSLQFNDPLMILVAWESKFAVYDQFTIVPLYTQNRLWQDVFHVQLADYIDDVETLDGFFFRISPFELYNQFVLLDQYFMKPYQLLYFPGWEKTLITAADGKMLYINNMWSIETQLIKLDLLKRYYDDFDRLWQFDLGSLDENTVIVRK